MSLAMILLALALLFGMAAMIWIMLGLLPLVLHLVVAGLVGTLADLVIPGSLPWGWVGAVLAGLLGSWLGTQLIGHVGPVLFDVPLIPAFVGAVLLAMGISAVGKLRADRTSRLR